ncbi:uncharacterized protein LOC142614928 [Castanea sativa]|uniref:uncharacterized protein LOC142614928 n=1 Tax=Castanea sativa TaxID=21020 RepID=UPI003F649F96
MGSKFEKTVIIDGKVYEYIVKREMTDEEIKRYYDQVNKSGGFDVEDFSHTVFLDGGGRIEPLDLSDDSNRQLVVDLSMEALDKYNTKQNKNFKFKEAEKANSEGYYCVVTLNCGFDYYITFKAEDASTAAIETFQALVYDGEPVREVKSIRVKPTSYYNQGNEADEDQTACCPEQS